MSRERWLSLSSLACLLLLAGSGCGDGGGGDRDSDAGSAFCAEAPCQNGGTCLELATSGYFCACAPGFAGDHCETDVDDCAEAVCLNGGVCTDGVDEYTCECAPGFAGSHCETDIDDCADSPCLNGGTCIDDIDSYTCECAVGFAGDDCECTFSADAPYDGTADGGGLEGFFLGYEFSPTEDVVVTKLGVVSFHGTATEITGDGPVDVTVDGLTEAAPVGLYDANGQIVTATVMPSSVESDGYKWADIEPMTLSAGETYAVVALIKPPNALSYIDDGTVAHDSRLGFSRVLSTESNGATELPAVYSSANAWANMYYSASLLIQNCN